MNSVHNPWTVKKIIVGKMFYFLVLTWAFTIVLNNFADKGLTYWANNHFDNPTIYTYNYSLGSNGIILAIPAAIISILIIKGLLSLTIRFLHTPIAKKLGLSKYLYRASADSEEWYSSFLLPLKIIKILVKALSFVILGVFSLMALIFSGGGSSSARGRGSSGGSPVYSGGTSSNLNNQQKLKSDAQWQARQKQKEANYAWRQAGKQARYNTNTYHFDSRVNRANSKQHEADKAAKRARNL